MRNWILALLGIVAVEFIVAPFGGRVFDYLFPAEHGFAGMMPDIPFYQWGYVSVLALGFVLGIAFSRWRFQRSNTQPGTISPPSVVERTRLIASWRNIIDDLERQYKQNRSLLIGPLLRKSPDYYRLEQYLGQDARDAINAASSGIQLRPALLVGGEETIEQRAIRILRQEVSRLEQESLLGHDWKLVPLQSEDRKRIAAATDRGHVSFDYSTDDGLVKLGSGDRAFHLRFSKCSNNRIYLYKDGTNLTSIARVKNARTGDEITISDYDASSRIYTIETGEHFIAANKKGYCMQARIDRIQHDTRGAERDEVSFDYEIGGVGQSAFRAL